MRVLAGPRVDLDPAGPAALLCTRLAGDTGEVISLAKSGIRNPYRSFSEAEVEALRATLRGAGKVVGFVCNGVSAAGVFTGAPSGPASGAPARVVVVTDHVNLAWRSPLTGPNDDRAGPRFPSMDGVYAPQAVLPATGEDGMIVACGVVAGVPDDRAMSEYETESVARSGWAAVSSELVAVVIVAAHMGLQVAAAVMV